MTRPACSPLVQPGGLPYNSILHENISNRVVRLCKRAVGAMELNLTGITVLTEAATGPFAVTPVLAALAGAEVRAVGRDSRWGTAFDAFDQVRELARRAGVAERIAFCDGPADTVANGCHLVTNLGPIRPIGESLIEQLDRHACIALMWEPWELRPGEIDLASLAKHGVPLIATNEHHPEIMTFTYLGPTIARLLLEIGVEIVQSRLLVIGSDPFGSEIVRFLERAGGSVFRDWSAPDLDAIVYVEHRDHDFVLGTDGRAAIQNWAESGAPVIRLCGRIDERALGNAGVSVFPSSNLDPGVMSATTAFAGQRPVIDLHAGGLRAGIDVIRSRQREKTLDEAVDLAVAKGFAMSVCHKQGVAGA